MPYFYNHKLKSAGTPVAFHFGSRHPFGHGLSYTTFEYKQLRLAKEQVEIEDGVVDLGFEVTNTGLRSGIEVTQLYVRDVHASVVRPVRELKAFQRVALHPGETARVRFVVPVDMLCLTDHGGERVLEPGWFDVMVGGSSTNLPLRAAVRVLGHAPRTLPARWRMESRGEVRTCDGATERQGPC
jgi:beta-glucosidase